MPRQREIEENRWRSIRYGRDGTQRDFQRGEVIARLQREIATTLRQPEVAARLTQDGTVIVGSAPQEFAAFLASERDKWGKVVKQTEIRVE